MENINIASFSEANTATVKGIWQYDFGQILRIAEMGSWCMQVSMKKEPRQEESLEIRQVEKSASGVITTSRGSMFTDIPEKSAMLAQ